MAKEPAKTSPTKTVLMTAYLSGLTTMAAPGDLYECDEAEAARLIEVGAAIEPPSSNKAEGA